MTSLLMSSPPISFSHRLFRCRYSNSRNVVKRSSSLPCPVARTQATQYSECGGTATENGKIKEKVSHKSKARDYGVLHPTTRLQRESLKTIGLMRKTANLHVQHNFFVHFFAFFAQLRRENA